MVIKKTPRELDKQRSAGLVVAAVLKYIGEVITNGMSTYDLDVLAEEKCRALGAVPSFKGLYGFTGAACISVNDEVIHGIPSKNKILKNGDIVSFDFGACKSGFHGDAAKTYIVGGESVATADAIELINVTEKALELGIAACVVGNRLGDIGNAIESYVKKFGFSVLRQYVGHGIGRSVHEDPSVPNYGKPGTGIRLSEGMVLAIEPMVNRGSCKVNTLDNDWTVVTADGSLSAHFEHTVAVTKNGPEILTIINGGQ